MAKLYIVGTPIGNLKDITVRALEILREADIIACEDTRHTRKLLTHYEISKRLVSYHSYNNESQARRILSFLEGGLDVALVSDGGTPGISDPGPLLVRMARERGIEVVPIPGVSSLTTIMSVSGIASKNFCFYGFLSPKRGRRKKELERIIESGYNSVLLESPHRITALLRDIAEINGELELRIGREMTKTHEEFLKGNALKLLTDFERRGKIRGEFTILLIGEKKV